MSPTCNHTVGPIVMLLYTIVTNRCCVILTHRHVWVITNQHWLGWHANVLGHSADDNPWFWMRRCGRQSTYCTVHPNVLACQKLTLQTVPPVLLPLMCSVCQMLKSGVAALFGPESGTTSSHVQSICDAMEIPHIETRWDYLTKRDDYSINLYPSPKQISRVR